MRERQFTIRVDNEDIRLIKQLAAREERSASDAIRRLVRQAVAQPKRQEEKHAIDYPASR